MAREIQYQGLSELSVLVEDTSKYSSDYFQITTFPGVFTAGKNLFRFKGVADKFVEDSDILIEVLDSNGQPIYHEADLNLESNDQSVIISVYIDEETPPGLGEIILCGYLANTANSEVTDADLAPSIRWSQPIDIDPSKQNDSEIIFNVQPSISISTSSVVDAYTVVTYSNSALVKSASITNFTYDYRNQGDPVIIGTVNTANITTLDVAGAATFEVSRSNFTGTPSSNYTLTTNILASPVVSYIKTGSNFVFSLYEPFSSEIEGSTQTHTFTKGTGTTGTLYFDQSASSAVNSENTYTVISASFTNLQPQTGNIAKIRTFYKSLGVGEFVLASETDILELATEFGYTPESASIIVPLPTVQRNDRFDLKFQFLNSAEAVSKQVLFTKDVTMPGGNSYIGGDDNLITGSVYIAGQTGAGVSIEGSRVGAMIRSVGYEGFQNVVATGATGRPGFIMYSGSVAPMLLSNKTEAYSGIGLELTAHSESYLRYTTANNGLLDIRTNRFFLGSSAQYISGSNGNIAISSSNFFLDAAGNVKMSGQVSATSGDVGGFNITSTRLYTDSVLTGTSIPKIELNGSSGAISGSDVLLRRRVGSTNYTLLDTANGIIDASNVGRQVVMDSNVYSRYNTNDASSYFDTSPIASWVFNVLPGETDLEISYNQLSWADGSSGVVKCFVRFELYYLAAANSGSGTGTDYYDTWTLGGSAVGPGLDVTFATTSSQWVMPGVSNSAYESKNIDISGTDYQSKVVKLVAKIRNDRFSGTTANGWTDIKNICAYTTRQYSALVKNAITTNGSGGSKA
jgi:hypothetical protein